MTTFRSNPPNISIINASEKITDEQVHNLRDALNVQLNRDFLPIWGIDADLYAIKKGRAPNPDNWWLVILDNPDIAGALGYHDLTSEGYPAGKVFVDVAQRYGEPWESVASHELLEMLADPYVYLTAGPDNRGYSWAYEVCDPCQEETYDIYGLKMSNFVYPAWFGTMPSYSGKYDHLGTIKQPFEIRPDGYCQLFVPGAGWQNLFGRSHPSEKILLRARKPVGSRTERRRAMLTDDQWICSHPMTP